MAARTTPTEATPTEIYRVTRPGGLVAIYEQHGDGSVTRRVERDAVEGDALGGDAA